MHWTEIARFELTDEWQWSAPVEGALFRVRHLNQVESRGFLAQLFLDGSRPQLLEMTRIRSQNEAQLFTFFAPDDLADRRIAARLSSASMEAWEIAIDVLEAETPIEADNLLDLLTAALTAHGQESNPHPQYVTANDLADAVVAVNNLVATREAIGVAATALDVHTNSIDPHPQYVADSDFTAAVATLNGAIATKENSGAATAALIAHMQTSDPHPGYATDTDLAAHTAAADPHPQYATDTNLTNAVATLNAAIANKENSGVVSSALAAHTAATDPHPQYATDTDLTNAVATLNAAIANQGNGEAVSSALDAHTAAADPHPQYLTEDQFWAANSDMSEAMANYANSASDALAAHTAAADPHSGYLLESSLETALAALRGHWEFRQTAKPTTRPNSSPLVIGDRWLDTTERRWWFWDGSYWLSEQIERVWVVPGLTGSANPALPISSQYNVFLLDMRINGTFTSPQDAANHWEFVLERVADGALTATAIGPLLTTAAFNFTGASQARRASQDINQFVDLQTLNIGTFRASIRRIGSGGTGGNVNYQVRFRHAR